MDRQRCVINAIIKQANPTNMLARYEDIVKAGKQLVDTDMPREVLPLMVELSLRVKDGNVRSVVFKYGVDGFTSPNPDFRLMRKRVKAAIKETKNQKSAKKSRRRSQDEDVADSLRLPAEGRGHRATGTLTCGTRSPFSPFFLFVDPVAAAGVQPLGESSDPAAWKLGAAEHWRGLTYRRPSAGRRRPD